MKHTLHVFLITIFLLSGSNSFAEIKSNDYYVCPTASISYASTSFCSSDTNTQNVILTGTDAYLGGFFTSTSGLTINSVTGAITPSTSMPGTYTVVYTIPSGPGCPGIAVTTSVAIYPQVNAGTDSSTTICESSTVTIPLYSLIIGEQTGGTWTRTSGTGGTFNAVSGTFTPAMGATSSTFVYTINGTAPCSDDSSVATININPQANAGIDGTFYVCENNLSPIDLFSIITGEQAGGTWVRTSGTGGTFNAAAGTFTLSFGATSSTFSYTLTSSAPCINDMSIATVTIGSVPTGITISGSTTTCTGTPVNLTITSTPGTVINWTGLPSSLTISPSGSSVISVSPTVTTTYSLLSASLNGCNIPLTQSATVVVSATPQFITQIPDITICDGGTLNIASQLSSTIPGTTFIWSATTTNVNVFSFNGDQTNIDQIVNLINSSVNGTISISVVPQIGSCSGTSQQIFVTIKPIPVITSATANQTTICDNQSVTITANSNPFATAYIWQVNTAAGVQIVGGATSGTSATGIIDVQLSLTNPLVAGTINFDITPVNGICTGATITNAATVSVNPIPGTPIAFPTYEICSGDTANLTITAFPNIAGTILEWAVTDSQNVIGFSNGIGSTINDVLVNTSNIQGYVKYSVTTKLGDCEGGTTDYIVNVNPLPNPVLTDGNICVYATTGVTYQNYLLDTELSNLNFTYDWFLYNTTTDLYDQIAGANASTYEAIVAGSYKVIVTNTVTNCISQATAEIIEVSPATGISTTISDNLTLTVAVNPIGTGNLIYALDDGAWQQSNVFTGVEPGTHTVLVSDLEGCTNLTAMVDVNEESTDLVMYPNPSFDTLNFSYNSKVTSIQISNHIGQVVLTKDINLKNGTIDLSDLNLGIYNIQFETESGTVNQRIIKQ